MTTHPATKPHIGFIGMGNLGSSMAIRLLQNGYQLTVYDRTREKAQALEKHGAQVATSIRDLAIHNDFILSCVSDNHALSAIMLDPDGAISGASSSKLFIDLSSVSPTLSRHIAEAISAKGAHIIDAPVSGSTPQAKEGSLLIFVGGDKADYEKSLPILQTLGKSAFYMGDHGMGTTMKMVVNTLLGLGLQAVAEAMTLGEKAGLDKNQLIDILGQTTVVAPAHKGKLENLKNNSYPTQFSLAMMRKDFSLIMREAAELSVPMPATAAAEQVYAAALARGYTEDYSVMFKFMAELAGMQTESSRADTK